MSLTPCGSKLAAALRVAPIGRSSQACAMACTMACGPPVATLPAAPTPFVVASRRRAAQRRTRSLSTQQCTSQPSPSQVWLSHTAWPPRCRSWRRLHGSGVDYTASASTKCTRSRRRHWSGRCPKPPPQRGVGCRMQPRRVRPSRRQPHGATAGPWRPPRWHHKALRHHN